MHSGKVKHWGALLLVGISGFSTAVFYRLQLSGYAPLGQMPVTLGLMLTFLFAIRYLNLMQVTGGREAIANRLVKLVESQLVIEVSGAGGLPKPGSDGFYLLSPQDLWVIQVSDISGATSRWAAARSIKLTAHRSLKLEATAAAMLAGKDQDFRINPVVLLSRRQAGRDKTVTGLPVLNIEQLEQAIKQVARKWRPGERDRLLKQFGLN